MKNELMKPGDNGFGIEPYQLDKYRYLDKKLKLEKSLLGKNANVYRKPMDFSQKFMAGVFISLLVFSIVWLMITGELLCLFLIFFFLMGSIFSLDRGDKALYRDDKRLEDRFNYMKKLIEEDGIEKIYSDMKSSDRLFKITRLGNEYIFIKGSGFFRLSDIIDVDVKKAAGQNLGANVDAKIELGRGAKYMYDLLGVQSTFLSSRKLAAKREMVITRQKNAKGVPLKELPYADIGRNSFGADPHKAEMYAEIDKCFCISKRENSVLTGYELDEFRHMKKVMHDIIKNDGVDSVYSDLSTAETIAEGVLLGKMYLFLEGRVFFGLTKILRTKVENAWENAGYRLTLTVDHGEGQWKGYSTKMKYTIADCWGRSQSKLEEYNAIANKIMLAQKEAEKICKMTDTKNRSDSDDLWGNMHFTDIDEINRLVDIESLGALQYDFEHRDKDIGDDCCMVGRLYVFIKGRTIIRIKDIVGAEIVTVHFRNGNAIDNKPDISGREIEDNDLENAEFIRINTRADNVSKSYDVCLMKDHDALVKFKKTILERKANMNWY